MQRAGQQVLRVARTRHCLLLPHQVASTSEVQWHAKRGIKTPLQWARERFNPTQRKATPKEVEVAAKKQDEEKGVGSLFDALPKLIEQTEKETGTQLAASKRVFTEHKFSTANFKISRRKLNMLARQIAGKPIDHAILQMDFSQKRASKRIKSTLVLARQHAVEYKGLDRSKLVVAESWVTKGPNVHRRMEIKGRGKTGLRHHPDSKLSVILREGKGYDEKARDLKAKKLSKIRSPGLMREDKPLVNIPPIYAW